MDPHAAPNNNQPAIRSVLAPGAGAHDIVFDRAKPAAFARRLKGRRVEAGKRWGKHLWIELDRALILERPQFVRELRRRDGDQRTRRAELADLARAHHTAADDEAAPVSELGKQGQVLHGRDEIDPRGEEP